MAEVDNDPDVFDPESVKQQTEVARELQAGRQDEARRELNRRREAYVRVFSGAPIGDDLTIVKNDLRKFCRGGKTPWDDDPRVHALITGRNEVWQRIVQHTTMPLDDLYELLAGDK